MLAFQYTSTNAPGENDDFAEVVEAAEGVARRDPPLVTVTRGEGELDAEENEDAEPDSEPLLLLVHVGSVVVVASIERTEADADVLLLGDTVLDIVTLAESEPTGCQY